MSAGDLSRRWANRFAAVADEMTRMERPADIHPMLWQAQIDAARAQAKELFEEADRHDQEQAQCEH